MSETSEGAMIAMALGLALLALGIAGLRTMALRSVSLRILRALRDDIDPSTGFEAGVERRLADLDRHRLAQLEGDRLEITARGRRVARVSRLLSRVMGVRR